MIRHTIGFYAHCGVYCEIIDKMYQRAFVGEKAESVNANSSGFGSIIEALREKYEGHARTVEFERSRYLLWLGGIAAIAAVLSLFRSVTLVAQ